MLVFLLPAFRQWVCFGVVEQRVVTIAPRKTTGSDAHMFVGHKFGSVVMIVVLKLKEVGVQGREDDGWHRYIKENFLPKIWIELMATVRIGGHEASRGNAGKHRVGAE